MEATGELSVERSWGALHRHRPGDLPEHRRSGLVYAVEIAPEQNVTVTMTLTTPHCPMGPRSSRT